MRPEEIRVQISSLNDELKDTNKSVELKHSERNLLLKQIEELKEDKRKEQESLQKVKDSFEGIYLSHKQQTEVLIEQRKQIIVENDALVSVTTGLERKESDLLDKIKNLKDVKSELSEIKKELDEAEKNRPLIEAVKKELLVTIDGLNEAKVELDIINRQAETVKKEASELRSETLAWAIEMRAKVKEAIQGSTDLRIEWETKLKDLKIVEKRLKKVWPSNLPFPKIDAGIKSRN